MLNHGCNWTCETWIILCLRYPGDTASPTSLIRATLSENLLIPPPEFNGDALGVAESINTLRPQNRAPGIRSTLPNTRIPRRERFSTPATRPSEGQRTPREMYQNLGRPGRFSVNSRRASPTRQVNGVATKRVLGEPNAD